MVVNEMILSQPQCLSFLLPPQLPPSPLHLFTSKPHTKRVLNVFQEKLGSLSLRSRNIIISRSASRKEKESRFFDENGFVEDMDEYLNYMSLEYDSVWDTKPSWCQPWTITMTGVLVVVLSWLVLHSVVISTLVSALICAWWYIFLYSYPKQYGDMIADRRKKIKDGLEDTYGSKKGQSS